MTAEPARRTLVVANRTASLPALLEEVKRRAKAGARFALMVPPERGKDVHDWTHEEAAELVGEACRDDVELVEPGTDAAATIKQLVEEGRYDDIIVSTAEEHHVRWLHHDLPERIQHLGVRVLVIPPEPDAWKPIEGWPEQWAPHPVSGPGAY
jgi:hypothetical protein